VLLRLAYLGVTNAFAVLRLLPMSDRDKDVEILALRHQLAMLERQLGTTKVRFGASDRAFLAALLYRLPGDVLRGVRLLVRPDTVLRWHRDILARRPAHVLRVQIKPDPDEAASMPDPTERAVQRRVDFDLGNDSGLHRDERQRLAIGELARPSGRQWTWPRMPGIGSAEWQAAH
jgi:hypothetical protein